ncbi:flagellar brake protein [Alishewanella sp. BS5-314]|uniref:flagellar brake protein n=1 Tax=Alishewanella sp. BS5-314 TaxID=2755587 RepID=UPI0021BB28D3|nr:flagellar brake protein [Alishewanella sp. BS5-314]MCT8124661.1 flagellar brake protein [Alishewanella sp. BS5-314]
MKLDNKGSVNLDEIEQNSAFWQTFTLGLRIELQLLVNSGVRLRAELVGYEKKQYLILRLPSSEPVLPKQMLSHNTGMICRFVVEAEQGRIYAFKSELLNVVSQPQRMLIIRYPMVAQYLSLRADNRNPVHIPVQLENAEHGVLSSTLLDLSAKGGLVSIMDANPMLGRGETLILKLPAGLPAVAAVIKRSARPKGELRLGLEFNTPLSEGSLQKLMQLSKDH